MNIPRLTSRVVMIVVLIVCGASIVDPQPVSGSPLSTSSTYINFWIDQVKILKSTGDPIGSGEFRIFAIAADKYGHSAGLFCPANAPVSIQIGTVVSHPCSAGLFFKEEDISSGLVIMVSGVDEDQTTEIADLGYEVLSNGLASGIKNALVAKKIVSTSSGPLGIGLDLLTSFVTGKIQSWIEKADVLGSTGIYLSKSDGWGIATKKTIRTSDGGLEITYTISVSQNQPVVPNTPADSSTRVTPVNSSITSCPGARPFSVKVGDRAYVCTKSDRLIVRQSPAMSAGESLALYPGADFTIVEGPRCADAFTWWKVSIPTGTKYSCSTCARDYFNYTNQVSTGWVREGWDNKDTYFICKR
jgi:hypothetical protein